MSGNDVLTRLEALAPELPAEIERLEQQKAEIDVALRRLRKLHVDLTGGYTPARKPERKQRKPTPRLSISSERLLRIADTILAHEEPVTGPELTEEMGIGSGVISAALRHFRELEFVGKAGTRPPANGVGAGAQTWQVLDAHAIDELRAKVVSSTNGVAA